MRRGSNPTIEFQSEVAKLLGRGSSLRHQLRRRARKGAGGAGVAGAAADFRGVPGRPGVVFQGSGDDAHRGAGHKIRFSYPDGDTLPATADGRFRGNAELIREHSVEKDLEITPRTLPPNWGGEIMDFNHARQLLGQYDREDR